MGQRRHGEGTLYEERRPGRPLRYVVEHSYQGARKRQRFDTLEEAKAEAIRRAERALG